MLMRNNLCLRNANLTIPCREDKQMKDYDFELNENAGSFGFTGILYWRFSGKIIYLFINI